MISDISIFPSSTVPTLQSAKAASLAVSQTVKPGCTEKTVGPTGSSMSVWVEQRTTVYENQCLMHRKGYNVLNYGSSGHVFGAGGKRLMFRQSARSLMMDDILSIYESENALDDVAFISTIDKAMCTTLQCCSKRWV